MTIPATLVCKKCKQEKDINSFGLRKRNTFGRDRCCRDCVRVANTEAVAKMREVRAKELAQYPCAACGYNNPYAKEVHHLASSYKRFGKSQDIRYNLEDIYNKQAIALCSNCHSIFHGIHGGKNKPFPLYTEEETVSLIRAARSTS